MDMSAANRKGLSLFALIMIGIGSVLGSGWLFGAGTAAQVAGPAALAAWVIGAVFIGMIAMSYAEVGAAYPIPGGMARYGALSHGPVLGFITGWAVWIAVASLIPIESIAATQYMSSWSFGWARDLVDARSHQLTASGMVVALGLTFLLWLSCYWSVQLLAKINAALTLVKFAIPVPAVAALIASGFHTENFTAHGGFAPNGWTAVLTAVTTSGVVFAACALYWSKWPNTGIVTALTLPAAPVAALVLSRKGVKDLGRQFAPAWWIVFFLAALSLLSHLGSTDFGGRGVLPGGADIALVAAMALVTYFWAVRAGVRAHHAGLPGPDPVLDGSESPDDGSTAPERELTHV
ncbi:APC family permease [Streptomyces sp. NPDC029003]|uniref:APC family permease n=1 Tax=Streptomyces sp. NPDC029003 TaxID=3155125 RepID=UPI0033D552CB